MRKSTTEVLEVFKFEDDTGEVIQWASGQLEIIDAIVNRSAPDGRKRVEVIAATQYGKSLATAAGLCARLSSQAEKWGIIAGTKAKARIIAEYAIMFSLNNPILRSQLAPGTPLDRLRMKKSQDRLTFKRKGEFRVYSADSRRITDVSKSLMGFGAANVIEDESALVPDPLQATVMRMLGGSADNFLIKIGNPFHRNHFLRTWRSDRYHKIFIDYVRGIKEGRFTEDFIEEMRDEAMFDILYGCEFPEEGTMDVKGWLPLLTDVDIERAFVEDDQPFGERRLGCDVAGGGRNFSVMVLRGYNLAKKVYKENEPDTMIFVGNIIRSASDLKVKDRDIFIDKVGIGKGAFDRLRELKNRVVGVGGSSGPVDTTRYVNLRAEMYWRAREWILGGGKLEKDDDWYQLTKVKYKVADSSGKLKVMSKEDMLREAIDSPDVADAFAMTFAHSAPVPEYQQAPEPKAPRVDPYE